MAHAVRQRPSKIFKGTVDEVFSHWSEIPDGASVELRVFDNPAAETVADSAPAPELEPTKPKQLKAFGMLEGLLSVDDFLRRKHEDTLREDQPISERSRF